MTYVFISVASENVQFTQEPKQRWNYTNVRPDAYMFWWLYYSTNSAGYSEVPLVMWLQVGTPIGAFIVFIYYLFDLMNGPKQNIHMHMFSSILILLTVLPLEGIGFASINSGTVLFHP